jgi:hypothetical protein
MGDLIVTREDIIAEFGEVLAYRMYPDGTLVVVHNNGEKHSYPGWRPKVKTQNVASVPVQKARTRKKR